MYSVLLISFLAVVNVIARAELPVSYWGQHRSLLSNTQSTKTHAYHHGLPASMYAAPSHNSFDHNGYTMTGLKDDSYNAAYRHSSTHHQTGYANAPTETQVHKHIYVHVPPKDFEDEDMTPRVIHQLATKQKHYKIVFIKAPSAPGVRAPFVPPTPQNEEKTLIYVLHKKPVPQPDIVIPTPTPTKPPKPEVYFIKYKTKKDEAPVYGPPPATYEIQARSVVEPAGKHDAPVSNDANDFVPNDLSQHSVQITTAQPSIIEEAAESYSAPSKSAFLGTTEHITAANPSQQYMAPESTSAPIVVAEMEGQPRVPDIIYGTPKRYFIKKRNKRNGVNVPH